VTVLRMRLHAELLEKELEPVGSIRIGYKYDAVKEGRQLGSQHVRLIQHAYHFPLMSFSLNMR
jgi:hypothetical protein